MSSVLRGVREPSAIRDPPRGSGWPHYIGGAGRRILGRLRSLRAAHRRAHSLQIDPTSSPWRGPALVAGGGKTRRHLERRGSKYTYSSYGTGAGGTIPVSPSPSRKRSRNRPWRRVD